MRSRLNIAIWGLAVLLTGAFVVTLRAYGQENSVEVVKRKVRTRVLPDYPLLARHMNVTGKVKIDVTVAANGHVLTTKVIGGSPLLVSSALEALKKWRFEPAPKDTTETVEFEFNGQGN